MGNNWRVRLSAGPNSDIQASFHRQAAGLHHLAMLSRAIRQSYPMSNPRDAGARPPR
jgi:hypothetical protein